MGDGVPVDMPDVPGGGISIEAAREEAGARREAEEEEKEGWQGMHKDLTRSITFLMSTRLEVGRLLLRAGVLTALAMRRCTARRRRSTPSSRPGTVTSRRRRPRPSLSMRRQWTYASSARRDDAPTSSCRSQRSFHSVHASA